MNKQLERQTTGRHYGLDLLRILSMLLIVLLHVIGRSGAMGLVHKDSLGYYGLQMAYFGTLVAVNCYAMLSGYLGIGRRNRFASISGLWLQVFTYSFGIALCARFLGGQDSLKEAAFPLLYNRYWYFTGYFILFLLAPVLNTALEKLTVPQLGGIVVLMGMAFSIGGLFGDVFILNNGYSAHWLIYLYLLGGLFRKTGTGTGRIRWLAVFLATVALNVAWQRAALYFRWDTIGYCSYYNNPLVVLGAVSLFLFCANLKIKAGRLMGKLVGAVAPLCFGVYLLHTHPWVFEKLKSLLTSLVKTNSVLTSMAMLLLCMLGLFFGCAAVEALRQLIFRWLHIQPLLKKLGTKMDSLPEKIFGSKEK